MIILKYILKKQGVVVTVTNHQIPAPHDGLCSTEVVTYSKYKHHTMKVNVVSRNEAPVKNFEAT